MPLTDEEKRAAEFIELAGPMLQALGRSAGVDEVHDVGAMLAKMPVDAVVEWFARWRVDLIDITTGTMEIGPGVEVMRDR